MGFGTPTQQYGASGCVVDATFGFDALLFLSEGCAYHYCVLHEDR